MDRTPKIAAYFRHRMDDDAFRNEHPEKNFREMQQHFPGLTLEELLAAVRMADEDRQAEYEAEKRTINKSIRLLKGLPKGTHLADAVRIRAAEGDEYALRLQAYWNSPASKLASALTEAAIEAHPGIHRTDEPGVWTVDKGVPEDDALIRWFRVTHPAEAAAIESQFPDA